MNRQFVFRHYWWIALTFGILAATLVLGFGGRDRTSLLGAVLASAIGFCYFVQQQKLAETTLFHKVFTEFNARYDKLNGPLAELLSTSDLTIQQRHMIVDYFNLCAEEYLFYREGYIPRAVWRSWCRGMAWHLKRHPFKDIWNEEISTASFYGLTLDEIHAGAI